VTIVLTIHAVRYVYAADELLILGQRGTIEPQGNIEHLRLTDQHVRDILKDVRQIDQEDGSTVSDEPIPQYLQQPTEFKALDAARQCEDFAAYGYYLKQISLLNLVIFVVLNCIYVFCTRFSQVWVEYWVNAEATNPSPRTSAIYGLSYLALSLGAASFFDLTLLFMFQVMVPRSAQEMHWELLQSTIHASYSFLSAVDPGTTLNRFSQDMTLLDLELPSYAVQFSFYLFSWVGQTILITIEVKYVAALITRLQKRNPRK
jgi:ATP-binding cassette subfamily C (CFTR/MRP) protein 1